MDIDQLLQAYARGVAHEMGKHTTTNTSELEAYGRLHFTPQQFLGVYAADVTPPRTKDRCFYIQNTEPSSEDGEHWLGIARQPGRRDLLFDTFARRPSATFLPHLRGKALAEAFGCAAPSKRGRAVGHFDGFFRLSSVSHVRSPKSSSERSPNTRALACSSELS